MPLTRDEILASSDLRTEEIEVPEWGGTVLVRGLTSAERGRAEEIFANWRDKGGSFASYQYLLAAWCIVDESGKRLFSDNDVRVLGQKSSAALARVAEAVMRLSALTKQDVEELQKNSGATPRDASPSG